MAPETPARDPHRRRRSAHPPIAPTRLAALFLAAGVAAAVAGCSSDRGRDDDEVCGRPTGQPNEYTIVDDDECDSDSHHSSGSSILKGSKAKKGDTIVHRGDTFKPRGGFGETSGSGGRSSGG